MGKQALRAPFTPRQRAQSPGAGARAALPLSSLCARAAQRELGISILTALPESADTATAPLARACVPVTGQTRGEGPAAALASNVLSFGFLEGPQGKVGAAASKAAF